MGLASDLQIRLRQAVHDKVWIQPFPRYGCQCGNTSGNRLRTHGTIKRTRIDQLALLRVRLPEGRSDGHLGSTTAQLQSMTKAKVLGG